MRYKFLASNLLCLLILFSFNYSYSQDTARIVGYNLLNYPGSDTAVRHPYFRIVAKTLNPDILVVSEMDSQNGMNYFLNNVLNAYGNVYSAGVFINGPDSDNGIFFKTSKFQFISNTRIITQLRDINEFKIIHVNHPYDTLRIYAVHLRAGTGTTNENLRAAEVDSLRKFTSNLPANKFYLVLGDFNMYGDYEPAYVKLKQILNGNGYFIDVYNLPGVWDNPAYSIYHTQSTRVRNFGGGATGGLDDRFDMILFSQGILSGGNIRFINNSMFAYGNDGNHYNDSINKRPNYAVPDSVADALHYASDHLPIAASFVFGSPLGFKQISNEIPDSFIIQQNYPNPFNSSTVIKFKIASVYNSENNTIFTKITLYNSQGKLSGVLLHQFLKPGIYEYNWNAENYPSGIYFCKFETPLHTQTIKMILVK
jgi:endonuclease/exonuclease/phosphatase family metal-dependent hydrolase